MVDASVAAGQKYPAEQRFVRFAVLPTARHDPGAQAMQDDADAYAAPPAENVPEGQGLIVPVDWPERQ